MLRDTKYSGILILGVRGLTHVNESLSYGVGGMKINKAIMIAKILCPTGKYLNIELKHVPEMA